MPDPAPTPVTAALESVEEVTNDESDHEAIPEEDSEREPEYVRRFQASVDKFSESVERYMKGAAPQTQTNGSEKTATSTEKTEIPAAVVVPKKPHLITKMPKWF